MSDAKMVLMKDAAVTLGCFEIGSITPAVGRFASFANSLARPTAIKCVLAFQTVARFRLVDTLRFWFHCWFSHNHTVAYGLLIVKQKLTIRNDLLPLLSYPAQSVSLRFFSRNTVVKQMFIVVFLTVFFNIFPALSADMTRGLAAAQKGNYTAAFREWLPLAEDENPSAQFNIAQLYRLGRGVPRNYIKASQWYEKAAEQSHSAARYNLAVMYEKGLGVAINYAKAMEWYQKAANLDYGIAQFNLAIMYSLGQGTKRDLVKAYKWYAIAADRDVDGAVENLDKLAIRMSPKQLKDAKELAMDWINWRKKE